MSLYKILELESNTTEKEIKRAYHKLAKKWHPDKCNQPGCEHKFQQINNAYHILINEKSRKQYNFMNPDNQSHFEKFLQNIFKGNLQLNQLMQYGITLTKEDIDYLSDNLNSILNKFNYIEIINFFRNGITPRKTCNTTENICSDSEVDIWSSAQAEYYYDIPLSYQKLNSLDIKIGLNLSLEDIKMKKKRKIKINRNINGKNKTTTYIFELNNPYIIFSGGGDINDTCGNLIIKLSLPKNFEWSDNLIIYKYPINLYQMIYGVKIKIELGKEMIVFDNWIPSRDGNIIYMDNIKISNNYFAIKLYLNYKHNNDKEIILKNYFS